MGASHSVTTSVVESSAASAVQKSTQNCTTFVNGSNSIVVDGDGNVVGDVDQKLFLRVNAECMQGSQLSAGLVQSLSAQLSSDLSDKSVALTQWMDNTKDTVKSAVSQSVSSSIDLESVQACGKTIDGDNTLTITGSDNVVEDVTQSKVASLFQTCLFKDDSSAQSSASAATVANQNLASTSENPLAFIGDAVDAAFSDAAHSIAAVFIVFICVLGMYFALRSPRHAGAGAAKGSPAPAAPAAPGPSPDAGPSPPQ